jgi:hypothetical protein
MPSLSRKVSNGESIIVETYSPENLPPAFAEAASRRQVTPLCQRGEFLPPHPIPLPRWGEERERGLSQSSFRNFLMIFGMNKEKIKRPTEKKTLKERS